MFVFQEDLDHAGGMVRTQTPSFRAAAMIVITLVGATGCDRSRAEPNPVGPELPVEAVTRDIPQVEALYASSRASGATFDGTVPEDLQVRFDLASEDNGGEVRSLLIDATGDKVFFPLQRAPRSFKDEADVRGFFARSFGLEHPAADGDRMAMQDGAAYSRYSVRGTPYFYDPDPGIRYVVKDPLLAHLAGATGMIEVGGEVVCLDPDGDCSNGYPSYLEPDGIPTAPTHLTRCGNVIAGVPVCVESHAFYNQTWIFGTWVRHGANMRFTNWGALPSSQLDIQSLTFERAPGTPGLPLLIVTGLTPAVGVDSTEEAVQCWGNCPSNWVDVPAVCSRTRTIDPDLNATAVVGNGPANRPTIGTCP